MALNAMIVLNHDYSNYKAQCYQILSSHKIDGITGDSEQAMIDARGGIRLTETCALELCENPGYETISVSN